MAKKSAASTVWKIIVGLLVTLLILVLVAEFGLRWYIGHRMTEQFHDTVAAEGLSTDEDPSISFGAAPLLVGAAQKKISQMDMTTPSTLQIDGDEVKGQPASDIHIKELTMSDDPVAGELTATTSIPDDYLLVTFQNAIQDKSGIQGLGDAVITDIQANRADNVLDLEFGGGLLKLSLRPFAQDGALALEVTNSTLFGMQLPDQAKESVSQSLTDSLKEQFQGDLTLNDAHVTDGAVSLTMVGHDVPLNELSQQFGGAADAASTGAKQAA